MILLRPAALALMCLTVAGTACSSEPPWSDENSSRVLANNDQNEPFVWSPYSVEDQRWLRDNFSWSKTFALREPPIPDDPQTIEDLPPLYYVQIYVRNADELLELDEMGLHWDLAPLFDSEWPDYDRDIFLPFEGDLEDKGGQFAFAFITSPVYNAIRQATLEGEDTYAAMILREVPKEAGASEFGAVSYEYLEGKLTNFARPHLELTDDGDAKMQARINNSAAQDKRAGRWLRKIVRQVADIGRQSVDAVRSVLGKAATTFLKTTRIHGTIKVIERDSGFTGDMRRAWGEPGTFGEELTLRGTRVEVVHGWHFALHPTKIAADGTYSATVPRGMRTQVCVEADSSTARLEYGMLRPARHCWKHFESSGDDMKRDFVARQYEWYALAQFIDAREYAGTVLGYRPRKATVQVGRAANALSQQGGNSGDEIAFVPCLAARNAPVTLINVSFTRFHGQSDYAANPASRFFNSNSMGLE